MKMICIAFLSCEEEHGSRSAKWNTSYQRCRLVGPARIEHTILNNGCLTKLNHTALDKQNIMTNKILIVVAHIYFVQDMKQLCE